MQLSKLTKDVEAGNEHGRKWLGTWRDNIEDNIVDGFWTMDGAAEMLIRTINEDEPELVISLFQKLLVPAETGLDDNMMRGIHRAVVDGTTSMATRAAAEWPATTGFLFNKHMYHPEQYRCLDQTNPKARPVKGFVFALKGFLSNRPLRRAICDYPDPKLFETDSVRCLQQHLWRTGGQTEFYLRLVELIMHTVFVLLFCSRIADETNLRLYETHCTALTSCYEWSDDQPLQGLSQAPAFGWMRVLGFVVVLWSARYLLEELVTCQRLVPEKYMAVNKNVLERRSSFHGNRKIPKSLWQTRWASFMDFGRASWGARHMVELDDLLANIMAIVVVGVAWSGAGAGSIHILSAFLVALLIIRVCDQLIAVPRVGFWIDLLVQTFWEAFDIFVLVLGMVGGFSFIFRMLMPNEPAFMTWRTAVLSAYNAMLLSHEDDAFPQALSTWNGIVIQFFFLIYTFMSAIVVINMFIAQIGKTFNRMDGTKASRLTRNRLKLMTRMDRSPLKLRVGAAILLHLLRKVCGWLAKSSDDPDRVRNDPDHVARFDLVSFMQQYRPEKFFSGTTVDEIILNEGTVDEILRQFQGRHRALRGELKIKYGAAPALLTLARRTQANEDGYMIILKAASRSDEDTEHTQWVGRKGQDEQTKQNIEQTTQNEELKKQVAAIKQQMDEQNKELKVQNAELQNQLSDMAGILGQLSRRR
jgi:hypothetical protein